MNGRRAHEHRCFSMATSYPKHEITGVILAGGRAQRMGGRDKGLIELAGRTMASHVVDGLKPQVGALLINANRNRDAYARLGLPIVADVVGDYSGPLAGMASAMEHARTPYVVSAPCDSPLVPADLVQRLYLSLAEAQADLSVAHDGVRMQPVFALLRRSLLESILAFLKDGGRKIDRWFAMHVTAQADFSDSPETFLNVNTPEDREALEHKLDQHA